EPHQVVEQHAVDDELTWRRPAFVRERRVGDPPAVVLGAHEMLAWDEDVLQEDLVELLAPGHLAERTDGHARLLHVADEEADALRLRRRRIGTREQDA